MCPACSIRRKLLLSSTPLGMLAMAVTNPAQILTHTTAKPLFQTKLLLLSPPQGLFWGWILSSTLHQLWFCPSRAVTNKPGRLILFLLGEMKMDSAHGTSWDESKIGPNSPVLKEAAAWRESSGRG